MAINVPWLHGVLPILEHNLYIISEISTHNRSLKVATISPGGITRNASNTKNSLDVEVVSKF